MSTAAYLVYTICPQAILLMNYSSYADEVLLNLIAQQDRAAFEELYLRHSQIVFNLIVRIVRDRSIADEILQESFWQAWKKAGDYRGTGAGAAWLYRIARNKSLDVMRKEKRVAEHGAVENQIDDDSYLPMVVATSDSVPGGTSAVERQVAQRLDQQHLRDALATIPDEQRRCLELAYFEGYSQSQISKELDVALGTVKTRVRIGLEKLEHILRSAGYGG